MQSQSGAKNREHSRAYEDNSLRRDDEAGTGEGADDSQRSRHPYLRHHHPSSQALNKDLNTPTTEVSTLTTTTTTTTSRNIDDDNSNSVMMMDLGHDDYYHSIRKCTNDELQRRVERLTIENKKLREVLANIIGKHTSAVHRITELERLLDDIMTQRYQSRLRQEDITHDRITTSSQTHRKQSSSSSSSSLTALTRGTTVNSSSLQEAERSGNGNATSSSSSSASYPQQQQQRGLIDLSDQQEQLKQQQKYGRQEQQSLDTLTLTTKLARTAGNESSSSSSLSDLKTDFENPALDQLRAWKADNMDVSLTGTLRQELMENFVSKLPRQKADRIKNATKKERERWFSDCMRLIRKGILQSAQEEQEELNEGEGEEPLKITPVRNNLRSAVKLNFEDPALDRLRGWKTGNMDTNLTGALRQDLLVDLISKLPASSKGAIKKATKQERENWFSQCMRIVRRGIIESRRRKEQSLSQMEHDRKRKHPLVVSSSMREESNKTLKITSSASISSSSSSSSSSSTGKKPIISKRSSLSSSKIAFDDAALDRLRLWKTNNMDKSLIGPLRQELMEDLISKLPSSKGEAVKKATRTEREHWFSNCMRVVRRGLVRSSQEE